MIVFEHLIRFMDAKEVIDLLKLEPLPKEGGYFRQTSRSEKMLDGDYLPDRYSSQRHLYTSIYYLVTPESFSSMHLLPTDEIFHFYMGDPVFILQLPKKGKGTITHLGTDLANGERPQVVVPKYRWQGTKLLPGGQFALLGVTVSPGFEYDDFISPDGLDLVAQYPEFEEEIISLSPQHI